MVRHLNEMSLPDLKIEGKKNVLVIYPHPDDELGMSGGLINQLAHQANINLYVVSTTRGEHGDELLKLPPEQLAKIRSDEFKEVMQILGVKNSQLWNFTDGKMPDQEDAIKQKIKEFMNTYRINLVVTYEAAGLYGHPDHIVLSKIVHDLTKELRFDVLYGTLPDKILRRINLPSTLTYKDKVVPLTLDTIADPEFKLHVTKYAFARYRGYKKYKSQNMGQGKPIWLINLFVNYEYYTTKYD